MNKSRFIFRALATLAFSLAAIAADAADVTNQVKIADVPAAVQKTIHAQVGKGRLNSIEKITGDGQTTYDVEMHKNNRARSFTVGEEGKLLDIEVFIGETPAPVQATIRKEVGAGSIESITKVFEDEEPYFEVEITRDAKNRTFTLDRSGKLLTVQFFFAETPLPVQQTISKFFGGSKLGEITEVFDDGETNFQVEINPDTKVRLVSIDLQGNLVSQAESVELSATPAPVQATIKDLLKDGKLGTLLKTTEDDEVAYEVEFKRGDKSESVTIGADGKVSP